MPSELQYQPVQVLQYYSSVLFSEQAQYRLNYSTNRYSTVWMSQRGHTVQYCTVQCLYKYEYLASYCASSTGVQYWSIKHTAGYYCTVQYCDLTKYYSTAQ